MELYNLYSLLADILFWVMVILIIVVIIIAIANNGSGPMVIIFPVLIGTSGLGWQYFLGLRNENAPKTNLISPQLTSTGLNIQWSHVENARNYELKINNDTFNYPASKTNHNVSDLSSGSHEVSITAFGENNRFIDSYDEQTFYKLPQPTNLLFNTDTQILSWSSINVPPYEVSYNVYVVTDVVNFIQTTSTNSYDLSSLDESIVTVGIRSSSSDNFVLDSNRTDITMANGFDFNYENNFLSWDLLEGATGYRISANQASIDLPASTSQFDLKTWELFTPGIKEISVQPLRNNETFNSKTLSIGKTSLINSMEYELENGVVSWSNALAAEQYEVRVDNVLKTTTAMNVREYALSELPGLYEVSVTPRILSELEIMSDSKSLQVLHNVTPTLSGTTLSWTAIPNATYKVHITGRENPINVASNSYDLSLANLAAGDSQIRIEVLVVGKVIQYPFSKTIIVSRAQPVASINYENQVITWPASSNATSYTLTVNDVEVSGTHTSRSFDFSSYSPGIYTIAVTPNVVNGIPQVARSIRIVHLATLTFLNDILSWEPFAGATYSLEINNQAVSLPTPTQTSISTSLLALETGTNSIKLRISDTNGLIDFPYSNAVSVVKLGAITNLAYDGTQVTWNSVSNVNQYEVFLNSISQGLVNTTSFDLSTQPTDFYLVEVLPVGSLPNSITGVKSSLTLFHGFTISNNDGVLSWDLIANASYTLVYGSDNTELNLAQNTSFDLKTLTTLPAGTHSFKVKVAIQGQSNVQSPFSNTITLTKLASVTNIGYANGKLSWDSSETAVNYRLTLNGDVQTVSALEYSTALILGSNSVSVVTTKSGLYLPSEPISITLTTSRLTTPTISITRSTTFTTIWFVNVPLVTNAIRVQVTIRYYTDLTTFTTEIYDSNGNDKFVTSMEYVKIEVEAIALATSGSIYFDSLTATSERTFS